jgi:hypothetical protein
VGFVLTSRLPANRIGWLSLVAGLALGLSGFSSQYVLHALVAARGYLPAGQVFAWLYNWSWVIQTGMLASAVRPRATLRRRPTWSSSRPRCWSASRTRRWLPSRPA